ncbi:MAG: PAS domain S-box protein [Candidatus Moranbacteria bacterium]|nr:PAS domain S-box protein [Candidatus Moranbacteria bacterium]
MVIKSLKNKITIFVLSAILFFGFLAVAWVAAYGNESLVAQKKSETVLALVSMADHVEEWMDLERYSVELTAHNIVLVDALEQGENLLENNKLRIFLEEQKRKVSAKDIVVLDINGNVLTATGGIYFGHNFGYRNYFKDALANDVASEVVIGAISNDSNFVFSHRVVNREGKALGVALLITKTETAIKSLFGEMQDADQHKHMLVDDNGIVVASNDNEMALKSIGQLPYQTLQDINADKRYGDREIQSLRYNNVLDAIKEKAGVSVYDFFDNNNGKQELVGVAPVHKYPYSVVMEIQEVDLIWQIARVYYTLGLAVLISCLLAAVVIYYMLNKFLSPLKELRRVAEKISKNELDCELFLKTGDELEELSTAFNVMIKGLMRTKDDIEKRVELQTSDIRNKQLALENQEKAAMNILEDITGEKEKSEKMAIDLEKFKLAIENTNDQVVITDKDGVIVYSNPAMTKITGYSMEEAIGKTPALWGGQMSDQYYGAFWKTIKEKNEEYEGELYNKRKNGSTFLAHIHVAPILGDGEEVKFFVGVVRDISKERESQLQLKKDAEDLKSANSLIASQKERAENILAYLQSIGDGVIATDLEGKIIFFNEAAEKLTGATNEEAVGKKSNEIVFIAEEKNSKVLQDLIGDALAGGHVRKKVGEHYLIKSKEDLIMAISFRLSFIFDKNNKKQGCILVMRDVSEQREIEKTKDDFLSVAAHQLRTPLTGVRWSLEMLLDGDLGELPEAAKEALDQISKNNKRLILLVNDLLDVSRINMGKSKEEPIPVDVSSALQESINTLHSLAEERGINIVFEQKAKEIPMINIGPKHLFQSFENLLSNAIKYSPNGGAVKVLLDFKKNKVVINVSDNGIGIPKEDQEKIFGKFFRASNAALKETEGSGLGLNVVKSFIEDFGGNVSFVSKEGKGTTFTIELPTDFKS